ncbi:MAG: hypothetical protein JXA52_10400 [Planctomycetes bacterium]|nr:hypothetical protein [Planctomycetota bacterium]
MPGTEMTIFLAGIIQGSLPDAIESQDYREPILAALQETFPEADLYDPIAEYPDSLSFDDAKARSVFLDLMKRAAEADLLVAYVPSASMGTAIEIWEAYHAGKPVVVIGPLKLNWVIRFCADHTCENIDDFVEFAKGGGLKQLVKDKAERCMQ